MAGKVPSKADASSLLKILLSILKISFLSVSLLVTYADKNETQINVRNTETLKLLKKSIANARVKKGEPKLPFEKKIRLFFPGIEGRFEAFHVRLKHRHVARDNLAHLTLFIDPVDTSFGIELTAVKVSIERICHQTA